MLLIKKLRMGLLTYISGYNILGEFYAKINI
jgi:hypothetical protein